MHVVFKQYNQQQAFLLPPSLDELVKVDHPVRVVNEVMDKVDIDPLLKKFKGGGTSSYHPKMLLKVLVYAYITNTYSSRKIEEALQSNIHFMWLSGMSQPDHNTINRFRSDRLKDSLRYIFTQVVVLLAEQGVLSLREAYVDGTKIEANANRYTFVWGNAIKTSKEKMKQQLDELWKYAQQVAKEEMDDKDPGGFDKIDPQQVEQTIATINEALKDKDVPAKVKQKLNYAKKNWPSKLAQYEQQERIIGEDRSSYSKTDPDATFMRMKEDHMKNGQLKPGYNLQLSTNQQYITHYSLHQSSTDTGTLQKHLEHYLQQYNQHLQTVIADAGYGSEENYQYLEEKGLTSYVKYNYFDREQQGAKPKGVLSTDQLYYNQQQDCYYCPMGQRMDRIRDRKRTTRTGFVQTLARYQARNCSNCPMRGACHKAEGNKIMEVNQNMQRLRENSRHNLLSEAGIHYRKQRCVDVEPVFANIKHNHFFKRFMLRGLDKVQIETGLLAIAHNLRKKAA